MTNKELLYIEDALGHEKYYKTQCKDSYVALEDNELKSLVNDLANKHGEIFNGFYHLL